MPFERTSMYRAAAIAVGIAISGFPLISSTGAQAHMHHSMGMRPTAPLGTISAPKAAARPSVAQSRTSKAAPKKARVSPAPASRPGCSASRARRAGRARFLIADASSIAGRVEGAVHPEAELVELVWTPLDEALNLDLPDITRAALADLVQALDGGLDKGRPRPFYRQLRGKRLVEQL